jgi:antitoxin CptB
MTGMGRSSEGLDPRRRKILFRAWHRGIREMDLILGRFADLELAGLADADLDAFEQLLEAPDPALYAWISGEEPTPHEFESALLRRLRAFHPGVRDIR